MHFRRRASALGLIAIASLTLVGCTTAKKLTPLENLTIAKAQAAPAKAGVAVDPALVRATNAFSFRLLQQMDTGGKDDIVASPTSAAFALGMAQQGAKGATAEEFAKVLGSASDLDKAGQGYANLLSALRRTKGLEVAQGMWMQSGFEFEPAFLQANRDYFGTQLATVDLSHPDAVKPINAWIEESTHDRIKEMLQQLPDLTRLVLVSTIYFKGEWEHEFDTSLTAPRDFTAGNGERAKVPTMEAFPHGAPYRDTSSYQSVALPYRDSSVSMYVFLPKPGHEVTELERELARQDWSAVRTKFAERSGHLRLPKFHVKTKGELTDRLEALGMKTPFDVRRADFSGMTKTEPLHIEEVLQAAEVETDEQGTVAAAATFVDAPSGGVPNRSEFFEVIVDRPFLFVIADDRTGLILFTGAVRDPR